MKRETDNEPQLIDCACRNLRMITRVVTQYYDKALHDSGLKATQFFLLNSISSREGGISVNELADLSMMDQTTVTRNIEILRKKGYVNVKTVTCVKKYYCKRSGKKQTRRCHASLGRGSAENSAGYRAGTI